jgi:hypothetical protein
MSPYLHSAFPPSENSCLTSPFHSADLAVKLVISCCAGNRDNARPHVGNRTGHTAHEAACTRTPCAHPSFHSSNRCSRPPRACPLGLQYESVPRVVRAVQSSSQLPPGRLYFPDVAGGPAVLLPGHRDAAGEQYGEISIEQSAYFGTVCLNDIIALLEFAILEYESTCSRQIRSKLVCGKPRLLLCRCKKTFLLCTPCFSPAATSGLRVFEL